MIDIVDPRGEKARVEASSAEINWPNGFAGQRVGFLVTVNLMLRDSSANGLELTSDEGAVATLTLMKEGPMAKGGLERYQRFQENTDIVIVGVCDGGTAASQGAIDAAALANLGVPTILLCTDAFVGLAKISLPESCDGVQVLVIPHPLSSLTSAQTIELAKHTFPDLKLLLSDRPEASLDHSQDKVSSAQDLLKLVQQLTEVNGVELDYGSSDLMHELGLSDGLPVFLPTKERVNKILDFWPTPRLYDSTLIVPPRNGLATPAVIAANAVMTGMPPNIAPYAAAVTHALCDPNFQVFNLQTTTNPVTPVIVVGGPSTEKNGFNNKSGALGGGNVNNASLGRTLKLCMRNIGGASAESGVDPATIGQPGKYTFCFAELEGVVHWPPLRSQTKNALGANHDAVTLIGVTGTANMIIKATSAQELIEMIAKSIRSVGSNDYMFGGSPLLVLCPEHAQIFENEKISIQEVKQTLFEMTKLKFSDFAPKNQEMMRTPRLGDLGILTPDSDVPMTKNADGFLICVAGGASLHSAFMPSFGGSTPVSHAVELGA